MSSITKFFFNVVGTVSLVLAVAGIFLPLLPTTPFLLLASACYLKGSKRLHSWLMNNRHLGPYIEGFQQRRGIPLRAKVVTIAVIWASVLFSIYKLDIFAVKAMLVVGGLVMSTLILMMKTFKEQE